MTHNENPYPVDPVDSLTIGSIPDDELGPLFEGTIPDDAVTDVTTDNPIRIRTGTFADMPVNGALIGRPWLAIEAIHRDDPDRQVICTDITLTAENAIRVALEIIGTAVEALVEIGDQPDLDRSELRACRAVLEVFADTAREEADEFVAKAEVIIAAMENADVSTLGELFEGRGKGGR